MEVINLSKENSIIGQYMAEMRDAEYQKNRLLFRNNIMRVGEYEAFEISKRLKRTRLCWPRSSAPDCLFIRAFSTSSTMRATHSSRLTVNTPIKSITRWAYTWNTSLHPASTRKH